jgi:Na+/H+ antiporter NhaD/arsenite permease-like protein
LPTHLPSNVVSDAQLIAAYAVFLGSYLVFAVGKFPWMKIDRPGAAIIGSAVLFAFRIIGPGEAVAFIDFGTIVLLFSMMLIVGNLRLAGFFEWVNEAIVGRLHPRHLLPTVIFTSGVLSAFFVNDVICLVMVPFVIGVTRRMGLRPLPYLLALATASNIGSVATITGNPQNILIGSVSGIGYREFLWRLGPVAIFGLLLDWAILHWLYPHDDIKVPPLEDRRHASRTEPQRLRKSAIVILFVLAGFLAGVSPALVAALGAALMLITRTVEPRRVYDEIDWGLLVFFVGLFLIVGGADKSGIMDRLMSFTRSWNLERVGTFTVVTALLSNIVSNVPAVMLLKSAVPRFANPHTAWLTLAMASTLAGNLTITGSVANMIVVERARPEVQISWREYLRAGLPVAVVTIVVGAIWLWLIG